MYFSIYLNRILSGILFLLITCSSFAQNIKRIETGKPLNIVLMIGDGMGLAQIQSGLTVNHGQLNLTRFKSIGFSKTQSGSNYITDSGAGATALSCGKKTYNGAIGVTMDSTPCETILEYAENKGLSTGLVSTSAITHATPASFIAHDNTRNDYEGIATCFLKTDIDVFIGGGRDNFTHRKDNRNLVDELRAKKYQVLFSMDSIKQIRSGKLAGLTAQMHNPAKIEGRGNMLPDATGTALNILGQNKKGFFIMIEGSEIDFGGHANNTDYVVGEMIDFDKAIGVAMDYAVQNKNTLVIVTGDHETGGMAITDGSLVNGTVTAKFSTTSHTGIMVPVFAYGPGAELFQGIQENTDIFFKMMQLLDLKPVAADQSK